MKNFAYNNKFTGFLFFPLVYVSLKKFSTHFNCCSILYVSEKLICSKSGLNILDGNRIEIVELVAGRDDGSGMVTVDVNDSRFMGSDYDDSHVVRHERDHPQIIEPNRDDSCLV